MTMLTNHRILIGYVLSYLSYLPWIHRFRQRRRRDPDSVSPEARLWWLLYLAPLETIGLFGFAWTSLGPDHGIPWIAPMIFSTLIAIANYAIYQSSIDYQTAAYGPYAASATGGNDLARDFLAGIAALYSTPSKYEHAIVSKKYLLSNVRQCTQTSRNILLNMQLPSWAALRFL
jgi:hypothetical protein